MITFTMGIFKRRFGLDKFPLAQYSGYAFYFMLGAMASYYTNGPFILFLLSIILAQGIYYYKRGLKK